MSNPVQNGVVHKSIIPVENPVLGWGVYECRKVQVVNAETRQFQFFSDWVNIFLFDEEAAKAILVHLPRDSS